MPPKKLGTGNERKNCEGMSGERLKVREQWKKRKAIPNQFGWQVIWAVIPTSAMARARNISPSVAVRHHVPRSVATVALDERSGRTNSP